MKITPKQQEWLTANNMTLPIKCKMCDNHVKWRYLPGGGAFNIYCSTTCSRSDTKSQKEKREQTCIINHGHKHHFHSDEVQKKRKATMIERHGVECPFSSSEIQNKSRATNISRLGVEFPFQSESIQQKNIDNWNNKTEQQKHDIVDARKTTMIEQHGAEHPNQQHMLESLPLLKSKEWLEDQYITQRKTLTIIGKELGVSSFCIGRYAKKHNIEIRPNEIGSSIAEQSWIEWIMEQEGIFIQYEGNGGQYRIPGTRWKADGYCEANNTIYEFHGSPWHGNPRQNKLHPKNKSVTASTLYQKTKEREQAIIDLGYNLVVMWDDEVTYSYTH